MNLENIGANALDSTVEKLAKLPQNEVQRCIAGRFKHFLDEFMTPAEIQGQGHGYADGDMEEVIVAEDTYVRMFLFFIMIVLLAQSQLS